MLNESGSSVSLTAISLTWPLAKGNLWHVKVGGTVIWTGDEVPTETVLSEPWLLPSVELPNLDPKVLHFHFDEDEVSPGYSGSINFGTCTKPFSDSG